MDIMTHAKFYFNRPMLTLIFAIWASDPPPRAWRTTEKAGPDRVNESEVADVSEHDATLVNENQMVAMEEELHSPCTNDAPSQKKLKRGERISFNGIPGNFLTYTPNKTLGNVILRGNNSKPLRNSTH